MAITKKQQTNNPPDTEEVQVDATPKKQRGRPRNENYVSWDDAREMIRDELIPSRGKYFEWWDRNKPKSIPRFPYRVYVEEWTSWNDFLGTSNRFNEKRGTVWRPYDEAVLWVHAQKIGSFPEWMEFCRGGEKLPPDIPARPELAYKKWISWNHWLGNKPVEAIEAKQQAQRVSVFYILHETDVPENIMTYGVEQMGLSALKERWSTEKFDVIKLFWYEADKQSIIDNIIYHFSTPYLGSERQRITPNVFNVIYHMQGILETVRN